MNQTSRRRWFQLHLSTVIALTLVASGLLGLNIVRHRPNAGVFIDPGYRQDPEWEIGETRGIPFNHMRVQDVAILHGDSERPSPKSAQFHTMEWLFRGLLADSAIAVALLVATAIGIERVLRRRDSRRT